MTNPASEQIDAGRQVGIRVEPGRLLELESIIERGRASFMEVGAALAEIQSSKLYKAEYGTFDEYCRKRWDFGKSYGYRLINAMRMAETSPIGDRPENESQAREQLLAIAESRNDQEHEWHPSLAQEAMVERVGVLWDRFKEVTGTYEYCLLRKCCLGREIGLHLQALCGRGINVTKFTRLPLPFSEVTVARALSKIARKLGDKPKSAREAMGLAEIVLRIDGVNPGVKYRKPQNAVELSPPTAIYKAFNNAREIADRVIDGRKYWSEQTRQSVGEELSRHHKWLMTILDKFNV